MLYRIVIGVLVCIYYRLYDTIEPERVPLVTVVPPIQRDMEVDEESDGYIDVGDGCWRPNVLVTKFGRW